MLSLQWQAVSFKAEEYMILLPAVLKTWHTTQTRCAKSASRKKYITDLCVLRVLRYKMTEQSFSVVEFVYDNVELGGICLWGT